MGIKGDRLGDSPSWVDSEFGNNSYLWHRAIPRDDITSWLPVMAELWMSRRDMGYEDGNDIRRYRRMWKIWVMTCLIGFRIDCIGVCAVYVENVLMASMDNIILGCLPWCGSTQSILWLLKPHLAYTKCVTLNSAPKCYWTLWPLNNHSD